MKNETLRDHIVTELVRDPLNIKGLSDSPNTYNIVRSQDLRSALESAFNAGHKLGGIEDERTNRTLV